MVALTTWEHLKVFNNNIHGFMCYCEGHTLELKKRRSVPAKWVTRHCSHTWTPEKRNVTHHLMIYPRFPFYVHRAYPQCPVIKKLDVFRCSDVRIKARITFPLVSAGLDESSATSRLCAHCFLFTIRCMSAVRERAKETKPEINSSTPILCV